MESGLRLGERFWCACRHDLETRVGGGAERKFGDERGRNVFGNPADRGGVKTKGVKEKGCQDPAISQRASTNRKKGAGPQRSEKKQIGQGPEQEIRKVRGIPR